MKKRRYPIKKSHPVRNVFLILTLLVVCVGGTELLVCRFADPELYQCVTGPVYSAARRTYSKAKQAIDVKYAAAQSWVSDKKQSWDDWKAEREAAKHPIEEQVAGAPLLPSVDGDIDPNDTSSSQLVQRNDQETLTGGSVEIAYFAQSDPAWRDQPFGSDTVGPYGCGPTAMAMAVRSLTGTETDPAQIASWAASNGYWAAQSGSYHSIVAGVSSAFGLRAEPIDELTVSSLCTHLSGGEIAVALMKPGHFTQAGHFILLRGVTLSGNVLVADPTSRTRSLQAWNPQLILDELSTARDNGAPLWLLSKAV